MGAKPEPAAAVAAIGPEKVAHEFTSVYYRVASTQPGTLAQLYGADSEVSHAPGSNLVGPKGIAAGASALPLANKPVATVVSLDAMSSGAGGVVFVVAGALEGAPFTQTFVLSLADEGNAGHFYCRNDIFRFVTAAGPVPQTVLEPAPAASGADAAQIARAGAAAGDGTGAAAKSASSPAAGDPAVANGHASAAGEESDGYDSEEDGDDDDESESDEEEAVASGTDGSVANGTAVKGDEASSATPAQAPSKGTDATAPAATAAAAAAPVVEDPAKKSAIVAGGKAAAASAVGKNEGGSSGATGQAAKPSVSGKTKTWASIVSTTSGGGVSVPSASSTPAPAPAVSAGANAGGSPSTKAGEGSGGKPDASAAGPSYNTTAKAPYSGGHTGSHHHQNSHHNQHQKSNDTSGGGGWSSVDNKRQSNSHHGHQGHDGGFQKVMPSGQYGHNSGFKHHQGRVYGPSAVIQLSTLPTDRAKDWRTLQQEFLDEFNSYGFPVRNVEVKTHKGLAFIEYQDQAGVRAAVAEWAAGPRDKGNFKGIPLSVSEKRQRRPHMPGDGGPPGRGGRGGMRGGRGGGRGRGRGMPYSSNSGTGAHTTSAPAPATSSF